jgi:hypothetical protein
VPATSRRITPLTTTTPPPCRSSADVPALCCAGGTLQHDPNDSKPVGPRPIGRGLHVSVPRSKERRPGARPRRVSTYGATHDACPPNPRAPRRAPYCAAAAPRTRARSALQKTKTPKTLQVSRFADRGGQRLQLFQAKDAAPPKGRAGAGVEHRMLSRRPPFRTRALHCVTRRSRSTRGLDWEGGLRAAAQQLGRAAGAAVAASAVPNGRCDASPRGAASRRAGGRGAPGPKGLGRQLPQSYPHQARPEVADREGSGMGGIA